MYGFFYYLRVSFVFTCFLCSLTAINGTTGLLSSTVVDAELKVSKPPKAIPFLRFQLHQVLSLHLPSTSTILLECTIQNGIFVVHLYRKADVLTD